MIAPEPLLTWLRSQQEKHDMPVLELISFIKEIVHTSGGDLSEVMDWLECPESERDMVHATFNLK